MTTIPVLNTALALAMVLDQAAIPVQAVTEVHILEAAAIHLQAVHPQLTIVEVPHLAVLHQEVQVLLPEVPQNLQEPI